MEDSKADFWRSMRTFIRPYRAMLAFGIIALILTNVGLTLLPTLLKSAIDALQAERLHRLPDLVLLMAAVALLQGLFRIASRVLIFNSARRAEYDIRAQLFGHLQRLPVSFFLGTPTGQLMANMTNDILYVRALLAVGILQICNAFIVYALVIPTVLRMSWQLTLVSLVIYPLAFMASRPLMRRLFIASRKNQDTYGELNNVLNESFAGIRAVKLHGAYEFRRKLFESKLGEYVTTNMNMIRDRVIFSEMMSFASGLGVVFVLLIGGRDVAAGTMTLGTFVAFIAYLAILARPVYMLGWVVPVSQRGMSAFQRIQNILREPIETKEDEALALPQEPLAPQALHIQNLSFRYPTMPINGEGVEKPSNKEPPLTIKNLNLMIPAGSKVLITGPTASGKSTLMKLLAGLYLTRDGELRVGETLIEAKSLPWLRRQIGYCPQDAFVFSKSIEENVNFAEHLQREIEEAAQISLLANDKKQFPDEWKTMVGAEGVTLSGGQRQRTALARTFAKDASILVLDDPISQLDVNTAADVWQNIVDQYADKTVVLASQRIPAPGTLDQIYVLDEGEIIESGTHDELIKREGFYARSYYLQTLIGGMAA